MLSVSQYVLLLSLLLVMKNVMASATSADFDRCESLATKRLEMCLVLKARSVPAHSLEYVGVCWENSKQDYGRCYDQVIKSYAQPSPAEILAIQKEKERKKAADDKMRREIEARDQK